MAVVSIEKPGSLGSASPVEPGATGHPVSLEIPWAGRSSDFPAKHLELLIGDQPRFWIWQAQNRDGDHVRFSADSKWHDCGERVDGISEPDGDRKLVIMDDGFQLIDIPSEILEKLRALNTDRFRLVGEADPVGIPSMPKSSATAFSTAGPASDAGDCLYRDSGKRYEFRIDDGVVVATHPDGRRDRLTEAVSYARKRLGERHRAPPFDLVAAADGRVFAKARDQDAFYFAQMDDLFMHATWRGVIPVPSSYFKLDPEANTDGRRSADLTAALEGTFANHPHAERFPLFRAVLQQDATDLMVVRVRPRVWHLIDSRPPSTPSWMLGLALAVAGWLGKLLEVQLPDPLGKAVRDLKAELERQVKQARERDDSPPACVPVHPHVTYRSASGQEFTVSSISFRRVLDIGVGHVHHHQQYEGITGGEIQPVRQIDVFTWAYQFFNGPVFDGDGYIDGTCNFYALVELGDPGTSDPAGYALLYQDEQSYFSKRWRLVGPDDGGQLLFSLAANIDWSLYDFDRSAYWDPFVTGHVGPKSRLAVAAQVLLVTGDADDPESRSRIYSFNCSWSTMDRSWRWRALPKGAEIHYFEGSDEQSGAEPIADSNRDSVYPQTIRLRNDMTVQLKGTRRLPNAPGAEPGRWYQRYLPATNDLVPFPSQLRANEMPRHGYSHAWKFVREPVFELADRFSHFGVYDVVDSRVQYYVVEPASRADEQALAEMEGEPWEDFDHKLYRWAPKFPWAAPFYPLMLRNLWPGALDRKPPSSYNRVTRLRILRRGDRWIAMHWDKRDDELLPFGGPFLGDDQHLKFEAIENLSLKSAGRRATVALRSHRRLEQPPAVSRTELRWSEEASTATVLLFPPDGRDFANLWKVRMAALAPGQPGEATQLLNGMTSGHLRRRGLGSGFEYRWTPSADEGAALSRYCSAEGVREYGTSIWVEDIVGHVGIPEKLLWLKEAPPGDVRIEAVLPDPFGRDVQAETGEYVTLRSADARPVPLGGWYVQDKAGHRLVVPDPYEIAPGGTLRVYTGPGTNTSLHLYCGREAAVLNNKGDRIVLRTPDGTVVSSYEYDAAGRRLDE